VTTRSLAAFLLSVLVAGCGGTYPSPDDVRAADPTVAFCLTTELDAAPPIRVRRLRQTVEIDCAMLQQLQGRVTAAALDSALFEPGVIVVPRRGQLVPIRRVPEAECQLLRLEHPNGFSLITVVRYGSAGTVTVLGHGFDETGLLWPQEVSGASPSLDRCASSAEPADVRWSEPVPVGSSLRVQAAERTGSCTRLELRSAHATDVFAWEICAGDAHLPFQPGDLLDVTVADTARSGVQIEQRTSDTRGQRARVWLGHGSFAPASNDASKSPTITVRSDYVCRPTLSMPCRVPAVPALVDVSHWERRFELRSGERLAMRGASGSSLEVVVGQARQFPLVDRSCNSATGVAHQDVTYVAIERRYEPVTVVAEDVSSHE
jgi:hypothetical protein